MDHILEQLADSLPGAKSVEQLARPLLEILHIATGLESTYLTSIDAINNLQHVRMARNSGVMQIPEGLVVTWEDTLCKRALDEDRMFTDDVKNYWGNSETTKTLGIQTYLSAPIRNSNGELLGTLCAASTKSCPESKNALPVLQLFSSLIAIFIEREKLLEMLQMTNNKLSMYAMTDLLTGLPNRRALLEELHRLIVRGERAQTSILIGMIDLDNFKKINDQHGHMVGDCFLKEVSRRISQDLRESDFLGRLGGDEFLIISPGPGIKAYIEKSSDPIIKTGDAFIAARSMQTRTHIAIRGAYLLGDVELDYAGASVGVVALNPQNITAEDAIRFADVEMYEIKNTRK